MKEEEKDPQAPSYAARALDYHYASSFGFFEHPLNGPPPQQEQQGGVAFVPGEHPAMEAFASLLQKRASRREFSGQPLPGTVLKTVAWAGYGIADAGRDPHRRTVPSAGAIYALTLMVWVRQAGGGERTGIYRYIPQRHELELVSGDRDLPGISSLFHTRHIALDKAAACLFVVGDLDAYARKYGERAYRYMLLEAGHMVQNICLASAALEVAAIPAGGFDDLQVNDLLCGEGAGLTLYSIVLGGIQPCSGS